jgi:putative FmdB family regulatory protein
MPFYEYECSNCRFYVEVLQKISEQPLKKCPSCGKKTLRKLVSAPVFRLKGSGWYETDFKSDKEDKRNLAGAEKEQAASDAKTEAKPAAEAEAKPGAQTDTETEPKADAKAGAKADAKADAKAGGPSETTRTSGATGTQTAKPAKRKSAAAGRVAARKRLAPVRPRASGKPRRGR